MRYVPNEPEDRVLPIEEVFFSHYKISNVFGSGAHRGQPIESLVNSLQSGSVQSTDLLLKAVLFQGRVHSVNNRRLWALKEFQQRFPEQNVKVSVRIYKPDATTAKFILSYST